MPEQARWQKSSFSGGPQGECLYLAPTPQGTIRLRESDTPDVILATTREALTALLRHAKRPSAHNAPATD
ncbi:protein of unknown function [Streptomyces sp. yr375]|uniref:DUF397 domain-containing protein n=1 Tax=Streptomyces sp. yr375 TaxID=1761906 RepID=UPI0008D065DD|nr:DUF397 domain-containing protein [Streptomyces sp. yr375]SEQ66637.1 protein of unknown function [Streptomyces sp. yr375]